MSAQRDAGLQALQNGNSTDAVILLEAACQENPDDFDAQLFLGAAYGQVGKNTEAISAITHAVQLQPANAQARYNLAVAMEQGGYREQAVTALTQALTLQPEYPRAREALQRLQVGTSAPQSSAQSAPQPFSKPSSGPDAVASGTSEARQTPSADNALGTSFSQTPIASAAPGTSNAGGYASTSQAGYGQPGFGPPAQPPQTDVYGQQTPSAYVAPQVPGGEAVSPNALPAAGPYSPPASVAYGAPPEPYGAPPVAEVYGAQPAAPYGALPVPQTPGPYSVQPQVGAYGQTQPPTGYGPLPAPGTYAPAGTSTGYGQGRPYAESGPRSPMYEDGFDIVAAAKCWFQIIVRPAPFFREMAGSSGLMLPIAMALLYCVPVLAGMFMGGAAISSLFSKMPGVGPAIAGGGIVLTLVFVVPVVVIGMFLTAWVIHLMGLLFGNRNSYSSSFRAMVFAYAPMPIMGVLQSLLFMLDPLGQNPLIAVIRIVAIIWAVVLFVMAVSSQQQIDIGPAIGVAVLSAIALIVVIFGLVFGLSMVAVMIAMAAASSHSIIPLQ